jgi:hypothetical protein
MTSHQVGCKNLGIQMARFLRVFLVLIFLTLLVDILVRLVNPTPRIITTEIPIIASWIDIILAVEFGIPVGMEFYSRFL